ncbi:MAG: GNAT family N-acetyltransferase [Verrucomicrobia bacterium]|nr:MAG: GNAT family N-acetyltransferase [Verrucomicrobiota bacterium]
MVPAPFHIRRCQPDDAEAVYEVCLRTGDNGHDATGLFEDPKALGHIFVGPYLKLEQDLAFVLEDPQGVCGYALGALDSRKYYEAYRTKWLPQIRSRFAEPTGDPAGWTRTQQVYYEYYHPDVFLPEPYESYPSHLHIDLLPRAQGRGLGKELMRVLLDELAARGSPGVHLGLGATNARAERFYKRLGFHQLVRVGDVLYLGKQLP